MHAVKIYFNNSYIIFRSDWTLILLSLIDMLSGRETKMGWGLRNQIVMM